MRRWRSRVILIVSAAALFVGLMLIPNQPKPTKAAGETAASASVRVQPSVGRLRFDAADRASVEASVGVHEAFHTELSP